MLIELILLKTLFSNQKLLFLLFNLIAVSLEKEKGSLDLYFLKSNSDIFSHDQKINRRSLEYQFISITHQCFDEFSTQSAMKNFV